MANMIFSPSDFARQSLACIHCCAHYQSLQNFKFYEVPNVEVYLYFYIHNGTILLKKSDTTYAVSKSNIAFLPYSPDLSLDFTNCADLDFHVLYLSGSILPSFYTYYIEKITSPVSKTVSYDRFMTLLSRLPSSNERLLPTSEISLSRLIIDLIADTIFIREIQYIQSDMPEYLLVLQRLFHDNLEDNYTLDELAHMFHINKYKLIKEFKQYFLVPPMQYLLDLRIRKAKELLLSSNLKISQISEKAGFSNTNYFVHLFKKKIGLSPTDFRNNNSI